MAFSDFTVFNPFSKAGVAMHDDMHGMSAAFIEEELQTFLGSIEGRTVNDFVVDDPDDNKKKRIRANPGDIIIHQSSADAAMLRLHRRTSS